MSAPLVVNTTDGTCWTRREVERDGQPLYAPEKCPGCPEFLMATYAELEGHGIAGKAYVLPVPGGSEPVPVLREDPHDSPLHHPYRLGHDLPETGGVS